MSTETTAKVHWTKAAHDHFGELTDPTKQIIGSLVFQSVAYFAAQNALMSATVSDSMYGRDRGAFLRDLTTATEHGRTGRAAFAAVWLLSGRDRDHLDNLLESDENEGPCEWLADLLGEVVTEWPDGWNPWDSLSIDVADALAPEPEGGWGTVGEFLGRSASGERSETSA